MTMLVFSRLLRRRIAGVVVAGLVTAACGGTDAPVSDRAGDDSGGQAQTADARRLIRAPAMGGVELSLDPDSFFYNDGELMFVGRTLDAAAAGLGVNIILVSTTTEGVPVRSVDDLVSLIAAVPEISVEETDASIEALGLTFEGYRWQRDPGYAPAFVVTGSPVGFPPQGAGWGPTGLGEVFAAATGSGVVMLAAEGETQEELDETRLLLEEVAASLRFTGPGLDEVIGYGVHPVLEREMGPPPTPVAANPEGPDTLTAFTPAPAGRYQLEQLGLPATISLSGPDWQTKPNFPGLIALSSGRVNFGPNSDDLVFVRDVAELALTTPGPGRVADPIDVSSLDALDAMLDDPPPGLVIDDLESVDVGGVQARRFDVRLADRAACTVNEPCLYTFTTSYGFSKTIGPGIAARVWWLDTPDLSTVVFAAGADEGWLDAAAKAMVTMEFGDLGP